MGRTADRTLLDQWTSPGCTAQADGDVTTHADDRVPTSGGGCDDPDGLSSCSCGRHPLIPARLDPLIPTR